MHAISYDLCFHLVYNHDCVLFLCVIDLAMSPEHVQADSLPP